MSDKDRDVMGEGLDESDSMNVKGDQGKAEANGPGAEFREAMGDGPRKRRGGRVRSSDPMDPQNHIGHGCSLDPTREEGSDEEGSDEEMPEGLREALEGVAAFMRGESRSDVHCINMVTGERMTVHGTRDEVEQAIHAANDAAEVAATIRKAVRIGAVLGGVAVASSLLTLGLVHLFRRRSA